MFENNTTNYYEITRKDLNKEQFIYLLSWVSNLKCKRGKKEYKEWIIDNLHYRKYNNKEFKFYKKTKTEICTSTDHDKDKWEITGYFKQNIQPSLFPSSTNYIEENVVGLYFYYSKNINIIFYSNYKLTIIYNHSYDDDKKNAEMLLKKIMKLLTN